MLIRTRRNRTFALTSIAPYSRTLFGRALWAAALALAGCGGGGGGGGGGNGSATMYTVSSTVSGLVTGTSVVLQNNGGDNLSVTANGTLAFHTPIGSGKSYSITVLTQPVGATCMVTAGTGAISNSNVNVAVGCTPMSYSIGGNVSGLLPMQNVVLGDNGMSTTVSANGGFSFGSSVPSGSNYAVTVSTQPSGQSCTVASGSGTVAGANVSNVKVSCTANSYSLGVNVVGLLPNSHLVLQNNGADDLTIGSGGTFSFTQEVASGSSYSIRITGQPVGQTCSVSGGSGMVAAAPVTASVTCPWHVLYTGSWIFGASGVLGISGFAIDPSSGAIAALPTSPVTTSTQLTADWMGLSHDSSGKHLYNTVGWGPVLSTNANQADFYTFDVDPATAALVTVGAPLSIALPLAPVIFPTSIQMSPNGTLAYAQPTGSLLAVNPTTGALTSSGATAAWGTSSSSFGYPYIACATTPTGAFAYCASKPYVNTVANQGVVTQFGINANTGATTTLASVAAGNLPHLIAITPNGKFAYVVDGDASSGGPSNIWGYAIDSSSGALTPLAANPVTVSQQIQQFAVSPNGVGLYMVLRGGSLTAYRIDSISGALTQLPDVIATATCCGPYALTIDPSGKFIYVSGYPNLIYAATLDATTGALTQVAGSPFNAADPSISYNSRQAIALDIVPIL